MAASTDEHVDSHLDMLVAAAMVAAEQTAPARRSRWLQGRASLLQHLWPTGQR